MLLGNQMKNSRIIFLMYHAVLKTGDDGAEIDPQDRAYCVTEQEFLDDLSCVKESDWAFYDSAFESVDRTPLSQNAQWQIGITFDDAWEQHASVAATILKKFKIPAQFFLTTDQIGQSNKLSPEQVKQLSGEIGRAHV